MYALFRFVGTKEQFQLIIAARLIILYSCGTESALQASGIKGGRVCCSCHCSCVCHIVSVKQQALQYRHGRRKRRSADQKLACRHFCIVPLLLGPAMLVSDSKVMSE
jgi:hypothetical protein